jgi:hypothetical protein
VYTGHFAECQGHSTRQRRNTWAPVKLLCRVLWPWHSTKEASFAKCLLAHSAKKLTKGPVGGRFAECGSVDTRQRSNLFAECHLEHSAKAPSLLPVAVMAIFLCRVPSDTRQSLYRVPDKKYSAKKSLSMYCSPSSICWALHSAKILPSVFQESARFR